MFKRAMHRGLRNRLVAAGVDDARALVIADAVYPGVSDTPPLAIVDKREAARIVEEFLDKRRISYGQMMVRLFGQTDPL